MNVMKNKKLNNYNFLFEELYTIFKKNTQLSIQKRKFAKKLNVFIVITIILELLTLFLKKRFPLLTMIFNIIITLFIIILYVRQIINIKKEISKIVNIYYGELDFLLQQSKFKKIKSLSKLDELYNFLVQKQTSLLLQKNKKNSTLLVCCSFLVSAVSSFFLNKLLEQANTMHVIFIILEIILIIILTLLFTNMIINLINLLANRDDEEYIDMLIVLVREEKMKILDSKEKTILNKIKYVLKLGMYS